MRLLCIYKRRTFSVILVDEVPGSEFVRVVYLFTPGRGGGGGGGGGSHGLCSFSHFLVLLIN